MLSRRTFIGGSAAICALGATLRPSTAGAPIDLSKFPTLQQGIDSAGGKPAAFYLPAGWYTIEAPVVIQSNGQYIYGDGQEASIIVCADPEQDGIYVGHPNAADTHVHGFGLRGVGFKSASTKTGGAFLHLELVQTVSVADISMDGPYYGFQLTNATVLKLDNFDIRSPAANGIGIKIDGLLDSNDHWISNGIIRGNLSTLCRAGVQIENTRYTDLKSIDGYQCGIGLIMIATGKISIPGVSNVESVWTSKCSWDTCASHGVLAVTGVDGEVRRYRSNGDWFSSNNGSGFAIAGVGLMGGFDFVQTQVFNNQLNGFDLQAGTDFNIDDSRIGGNGMAQPNVYHGVKAWGGVNGLRVRNSIIGPNNQFTNMQQAYGVYIGPGPGDRFIITGNDLTGNGLGKVLDESTGRNKIMEPNIG